MFGPGKTRACGQPDRHRRAAHYLRAGITRGGGRPPRGAPGGGRGGCRREEGGAGGPAPPPPPRGPGTRKNPVPWGGKPLPYPIVIADRRNNRLIEITPDKRIVWEFSSPDLVLYRGNEDVNFSDDGKLLAVSEEDNYDVPSVEYE